MTEPFLKQRPRRETSLEHAAAHEPPSIVEAALGKFRDDEVAEAAKRAAAIALSAARWDTLSYLADFLADVTAHAGQSPAGLTQGAAADEDEPAEEVDEPAAPVEPDEPEDVCGCNEELAGDEPVLVDFAIPIPRPEDGVESILQYETPWTLAETEHEAL